MGRDRSRRVGIHDVARHAGVSVTTVSHALSGKGRLSDATRQRVQLAARELGYRAGALAQGLATGRKGLLALQISRADDSLVLPIFDIASFAELMHAAMLTALENEYWLSLAPPTANVDAWEQLRPDGAIIVDPVVADPVLAMLREKRVPVVTRGRSPSDPENGCWVDNDNARGTRRMLEHLEREGARSIALLMGRGSRSAFAIDTCRAYEEWCAKRKRKPIIGLVGETSDAQETDSAIYAAALELLGGDARPDAVYAMVDRYALAVLSAAQQTGIAVPDELLVAVASDSEASRHARPSLTTLNPHPESLGRAAVEMLIALVEGRTLPRRHRLVPTHLIPRESTAAVRRGRKRTRPAG
jgi:DNA-binding LacI/PurR family transcriptional regulator